MRRLLHLSTHAALLLLLVVNAAGAAPATTPGGEADKAKAPGVALMHNRLELNSLSFEELEAIFRQGTIDVCMCQYMCMCVCVPCLIEGVAWCSMPSMERVRVSILYQTHSQPTNHTRTHT